MEDFLEGVDLWARVDWNGMDWDGLGRIGWSIPPECLRMDGILWAIVLRMDIKKNLG